jgi:integrase
MAAIYQDGKSGVWHISFRFGGKQHHKSLKTTDGKKAEGWKAQIEETLHDLERGRLELPAGVNFWEFVKTDGKREEKPQVQAGMTLQGLFEWYFKNLPEGAKESKTCKVETIHTNHVKRLLGPRRDLNTITGQELQEGYVNKRAGETWHKKPIRSQTIQKEIETLRMVWNRAYRQKVGGVLCECPSGGMKYPKKKAKPPFQTWGQIEQTIARGGLSKAEEKELWDSLFLDLTQVSEVLAHVREKETRRRYFYPLLVFVAHTGARLSECMRSQVEDFDFGAMKVRIREKKRDQSSDTFRWVDMSDLLRDTMKDWFQTGHPGGSFTISRVANKKFREETLHDDFEWFMHGSKWKVLKGYHVFRHSFASNLARKGVAQDVIDALMGHQTEDMRRRYKHLFPEQKRSAVAALFG